MGKCCPDHFLDVHSFVCFQKHFVFIICCFWFYFLLVPEIINCTLILHLPSQNQVAKVMFFFCHICLLTLCAGVLARRCLQNMKQKNILASFCVDDSTSFPLHRKSPSSWLWSIHKYSWVQPKVLCCNLSSGAMPHN